MTLSERFRKDFVPAICTQTDSWTHPPSPKRVLELTDRIDELEGELTLVTEERERWKAEATKFGTAFKAAARVLRAIDFTPAHLGKESGKEQVMWMSWARGVIRVWTEHKEELLKHLGDGTQN